MTDLDAAILEMKSRSLAGEHLLALKFRSSLPLSVRMDRTIWFLALWCRWFLNEVTIESVRAYLIAYPDEAFVIRVTHDLAMGTPVMRRVSQLAFSTLPPTAPRFPRQGRSVALDRWQTAKDLSRIEAAHFIGRNLCFERHALDVRVRLIRDIKGIEIDIGPISVRY
jgi:hypothetical protein